MKSNNILQIRVLFLTLSYCIFFGVIIKAQLAPKGMAIRSDSKSENTQVISKQLERKFMRDAARLVLRMQSQSEELRFQGIEIEKQSVIEVYNLLSRIYLADSKAKSIANCNVHTFPNPSIDHFTVIFDKSVLWAMPLQMGINEVENDFLNDLMDEYNLVIEKHVQWNDTQDAISIRSQTPLNMAALANEVYNVEGVVNVDLGIPTATGNDIQINRSANGWQVRYVLRFGSSFEDSSSEHIWHYEVSDVGQIKLVREEGADIPDYLKCGLNLNLFPL